jgi:hypothetical protein
MAYRIAGTNVINDSAGFENITNTRTIDGLSIFSGGNIPVDDCPLLATLNPSGVNSINASGLNLTGYYMLVLVFNNLSHADTTTSRFILLGTSTATDIQCTPAFTNTTGSNGFIFVDLNNGAFMAHTAFNASGNFVNTTDTALYSGDTDITTAATTVSIAMSSGNFDSGSCRIVGVKI